MSQKAELEKRLLSKIRDKHILVIDDAGSMRDLVRSTLAELDLLNIKVSHNGLDGLDLLKKHKYDLVITDWDMPLMTGIEFIMEARKMHDKASLPIIMLTANIHADAIQQAIAEGVNDFIAKPFQPRALQLKVLKQLGSRV